MSVILLIYVDLNSPVGVRAELHRALKARGKTVQDPWYFPTAEEYRALLELQGFEVRRSGQRLRIAKLPVKIQQSLCHGSRPLQTG